MLNKLKVHELNEYITENKLSPKGNKQDKINAITADVLRKTHIRIVEDKSREEISDSDNEINQDLVLEEFGSDSETESELESKHKMLNQFLLLLKRVMDVLLEIGP